MLQTVDVPLWALVLLVVLAAWAALDRLLVPSVRWFLRRKVNRVLEDVGQHLRLKIEPFRLTKRAVLIDRLVYDPEVMEAAAAFAREEGMPREVAMARVERYAREIVPAFNAYFYFRIGYWLARRVAQLLYRVRLGVTDEEGLAAVDQGSTVVFIMNHRSNMDYILVAYLAAAQTALSYAVGEWARIWPLQTLIRSMGAYFVRRRSRDPLYRRVLARYIHMATTGGVTQAMYPEGGLTRDGRLAGLLLHRPARARPRGDLEQHPGFRQHRTRLPLLHPLPDPLQRLTIPLAPGRPVGEHLGVKCHRRSSVLTGRDQDGLTTLRQAKAELKGHRPPLRRLPYRDRRRDPTAIHQWRQPDGNVLGQARHRVVLPRHHPDRHRARGIPPAQEQPDLLPPGENLPGPPSDHPNGLEAPNLPSSHRSSFRARAPSRPDRPNRELQPVTRSLARRPGTQRQESGPPARH